MIRHLDRLERIIVWACVLVILALTILVFIDIVRAVAP